MFYPPAALEHMSGCAVEDQEDDDFRNKLQSFTSCSRNSDRIRSSRASLLTLCSLSLLASQIICQSHSGTSNLNTDRGHEGFSSWASMVWRPDFVEHALDNWLSSHSTSPTREIQILFHVLHIKINARIPTIQEYAQKAFSGELESSTSQSSRDTDANVLRQCFVGDETKIKALWHASQTLRIARELAERSAEDQHSPVGSADDGPARHVEDPSKDCNTPPHFSHCIFYAALCFWSIYRYDHYDDLAYPRESLLNQFRLAQALLMTPNCGIAKRFRGILELLGPSIGVPKSLNSHYIYK